MNKFKWIKIDHLTTRNAGMDVNKVKRYIEYGYIKVLDNKINVCEIHNISSFEKDLTSNYIRLSSLFNNHLGTGCSSFENFYEAYAYIFRFIDFSNQMILINHDKNQYINTSTVDIVKKMLIKRKEVLERLKIDDITFDSIVFRNKLNLLKFSKSAQFITLKSFQVMKDDIENKKSELKYHWQKAYDLQVGQKYTAISENKMGLLAKCEDYGVNVTEHNSIVYIDEIALIELKRCIEKIPSSYKNIKNLIVFMPEETKIDYKDLSRSERVELKDQLKKLNIKYLEIDHSKLHRHIFLEIDDYNKFRTTYKTYKHMRDRYKGSKLNIDDAIKSKDTTPIYLFGREYYSFEDLKNLRAAKPKVKSGYYTTLEVSKLLGVKGNKFLNKRKELDITVEYWMGKLIFKKEDIDELLVRIQNLRKNYVPISGFVAKNLGLQDKLIPGSVYISLAFETKGSTKLVLKKIFEEKNKKVYNTEYDSQNTYVNQDEKELNGKESDTYTFIQWRSEDQNCKQIKITLKVNNLSDLMERKIRLVNKLKKVNYNETVYVTRQRCAQILGIDYKQLTVLISDHEIPYEIISGRIQFNLKNILKIKEHNQYIIDNYIPTKTAVRLGMKNAYTRDDLYKATGLERYAFKECVVSLVPKKVIESAKKQGMKAERLSQIDYSEPFQAFREHLEVEEINISPAIDETFTEWIFFVKKRLINSQISTHHAENLVRLYINTTKKLVDFCKNTNIFDKTTNEINLFLLPIHKEHSKKRFIVMFLKDLFKYRKNSNLDVSYNPSKLNFTTGAGKTSNKKSNIGDLYEDKVFLELLYFCKQDFHKQLAIQDSLKHFEGANIKKSYDYAYSWFYLILHLNNAWRNVDFVKMEMIDLSFLNVETLEEFYDKDLTKIQVNKVISKLSSKKYIVSKTGEENKFFISEELKECLATAYVICHLLNNKLHPLSNRIIHFSNKRNQFLRKQHNIFSNFKYDIKFENRKMNKTLISAMVKIMSKYDDSAKNVHIAKALRSHKSIKSSVHYIKYTSEELNKITRHLFDKGIFGFIPNMLEHIVNSDKERSLSSLKNDEVLKIPIKNIYNIEVSAGFLNKIENEKESLIDYIESKGTDYIFDTMTKLSLDLMHAKDEKFQCLRADLGCNRPGLDCKSCLLSIPNRFSVSSIITSIEDSIVDIETNYNKYTKFEKVRVANRIFSELQLLHDAIEKFGSNDVFSMFDNDKQSYISILDLLDDINNKYNLIDSVSKTNLLEEH